MVWNNLNSTQRINVYINNESYDFSTHHRCKSIMSTTSSLFILYNFFLSFSFSTKYDFFYRGYKIHTANNKKLFDKCIRAKSIVRDRCTSKCCGLWRKWRGKWSGGSVWEWFRWNFHSFFSFSFTARENVPLPTILKMRLTKNAQFRRIALRSMFSWSL